MFETFNKKTEKYWNFKNSENIQVYREIVFIKKRMNKTVIYPGTKSILFVILQQCNGANSSPFGR